jgi:ribosomal protein L36
MLGSRHCAVFKREGQTRILNKREREREREREPNTPRTPYSRIGAEEAQPPVTKDHRPVTPR